jgi:hypothetical protein
MLSSGGGGILFLLFAVPTLLFNERFGLDLEVEKADFFRAFTLHFFLHLNMLIAVDSAVGVGKSNSLARFYYLTCYDSSSSV